MSYRKRQELLGLFAIIVAIAGCTTGLDAGSIEKAFTGVKSLTVTGPESIVVNWDPNSSCESYGIYRLGTDSDSSKIADATVPPYAIKAPTIESERSYSIAVGCTRAGKTTGLSTTKQDITWAKFLGSSMNAQIDTSGSTPVVVLSWAYNPAGVMFDVYADNSPLPTSVNSWKLTHSGATGSSYTNAKLCTVTGTSVRLGQGACPALVGGQSYMFKVVAHYPDGTYSEDQLGYGKYVDIPPPFAAPDCILTSSGIGADASTASLFLRCSDTNLTAVCAAGTMTTHAYQGVGGVRLSVSDTLPGAGTLRIQPQPQPTPSGGAAATAGQINDRAVEGLEIEYVCTTGALVQKSTIRYDGNPVSKPDGTTYVPVKPVLKYNSTDYVRAPNESKSEIPSYYGKAVAVGDFNCDGKPDLAVGLPDVTFNLPPYYSKNPGSGAVMVYYDYAIDATGAISATDTQVLSFSDLPMYAHMGASLSVGNINRDYYLQPSTAAADIKGKIFACDDLIIGAPGELHQNSTYYGQAFVFFGHPQKFSAPLNLSTLTVNDASCHGSIDSSVCDPVRLVENMQAQYKIDPGYNIKQQTNYANKSNFGYSVAYLRDFNADGYGDIAIGNPNCNWDGEVRNGGGTLGTGENSIYNVGCVFVYFGGPNGITLTDVGAEPGTGGTRMLAPFVKIYPPVLQDRMAFGTSIGAGGDIDGRLPVPLVNNAGNVVLAEGSDFVVGAPGFSYNTSAGKGGVFSVPGSWTRFQSATVENVDPLVQDSTGSAFNVSTPQVVSNKNVTPFNGAWSTVSSWGAGDMPVPSNAKLAQSTGIAFAYLGRSSAAEYQLVQQPNTFYRLPDGIDTPSGQPTTLSLISANTQSRQNGSKGFTLKAALLGTNPIDSFYNCGTRGSPGGLGANLSGQTGGSHKHISCLAGRNNVSWIFPQLSTTDEPVHNFGSNITIAGTKEQNPLALLNLGGGTRILNPGSDVYQKQSGDGSKFRGYAQADIHERIRGDSLWELGIHASTYSDGSATQLCETASGTIASYSALSYTNQTCLDGRPARAAILESYANIPGVVAPNARIQEDINRDGYADIIVTATNTSGGVETGGVVYTYFGNYAADFSYPSTLVRNGVVAQPYTTSTSCTVNNLTNAVAAAAADTVPFQTFGWTHSIETGGYNFSSTYPVRPMAAAGSYGYRLGYLGDIAGGGSANLWGFGDVSYSNAIRDAAKACLPQRRTYLTMPTSLVAADANDDHIVDGILGFPDETSQSGMARVLLANSGTGGGLGSEFPYNTGAGNYSRTGSSVASVNWNFVSPAADSYEMNRRDLFAGAPYQTRGNGAVLAYSGVNGGQISTGVPTTLTMPAAYPAIPSALNAENSVILGDVNGDGFDDIFVPVKRLDARGSVYYDAIIYFGSANGPMTTPHCSDLVRLGVIKKSNGTPIVDDDCKASVSGLSALVGTSPVRLPQYYNRPSGMSADWALRVQPAGDINGDGRSDAYVSDYNASMIYALFGSDIGLTGGSPAMGPSGNKGPQIVTANGALIRKDAISPITQSAGYLTDGVTRTTEIPTGSGLTVVHGDFNGDGYEDVAFGYPNSDSIQMQAGWKCNPTTGSYGNISYCGFSGSINGVTYSVNNPINGRRLYYSGFVWVMYGSPTGVQTPVNGSGTAVDFDYAINTTCKSFYHDCKKAGPASLNYLGDATHAGQSASLADSGGAAPELSHVYSRMVYGSLTQSGSGYNINVGSTDPVDILTSHAQDADPDKRRPPCVAGSGARAAAICVATEIPNPAFYNVDNSYSSLGGMYFGNSMTVADVNGDGVDDLIVGNNTNYLSGVSQLNTLANFPNQLPGSDETVRHGSAFIYYGAKSFGLVAPAAERYLGQESKGIDTAGNPINSRLVFQLYPTFDATHTPTLDSSETNRNFAMNMTSGDFNGDGKDDIAIATGKGAVYVYYGPICQWDNSVQAIGSGSTYSMYRFPNTSIAAPTMTTGNCQTLDLSQPTMLSPQMADVPSKPLAPQMIQIAGLAGNEFMGTTLISSRKGHGNVKNPGNGTGQIASDLIIAGPSANDPNASTLSYKYTGLGFAYFGHKSGDPLFNTKGGLYIGNPSYNSSIVKVDEVVSGVTTSYYYYSPIVLRPHATDASVGRFFMNQVSAGDLNGDNRMDLMMTTTDLDKTQDNTDASYGGGFRLFY